jgi:hypothetical protein
MSRLGQIGQILIQDRMATAGSPGIMQTEGEKPLKSTPVAKRTTRTPKPAGFLAPENRYA